jgi:large subunit ribosomal protein L3
MTTKAIVGRKIGMTQVFNEEGNVTGVTVIEAGPCEVIQVKTADRDGYSAIQLGFEERKESKVKKPLLGHFKKAKLSPKKVLKEIRVGPHEKFEVGQKITVDIFEEGEYIDVTGKSIGKGFQGGIKRWHWSGGPKTHGSMSHRAPGSIGASAFPSRVFKGHHLPGHMGYDTVTVQNLEIVKIDKEHNLILVKGHVPGKRNNLLILERAKKKPHKKEKPKAQEHTEKKGEAKKEASLNNKEKASLGKEGK